MAENTQRAACPTPVTSSLTAFPLAARWWVSTPGPEAGCWKAFTFINSKHRLPMRLRVLISSMLRSLTAGRGFYTRFRRKPGAWDCRLTTVRPPSGTTRPVQSILQNLTFLNAAPAPVLAKESATSTIKPGLEPPAMNRSILPAAGREIFNTNGSAANNWARMSGIRAMKMTIYSVFLLTGKTAFR